MPTPNTLTTTDSVAVLLATGFEEVEALAVVDALYRAGIRADLISIENERHVASSHGIKLVADLMLDDADLASYTVVFLPGGMPGTLGLKANERVREELTCRASNGEKTAAICAAPSILAELGVLQGKRATANPGFMAALSAGGAQAETTPVVVDGNIVTSRGAGTALELGFELVRQLLGDEAAQQVRESVVWEH
ncbi:MAG: DJ-1/PfpI family protein [Dermabacter sp.]|nr:DJ-1/PfpI family protein [Dermabacter sp.]